MRNSKGIIYAIVALTMLWAISGCSDSTTDSAFDLDEESILAIIDGEDEVLGFDGIEDEDLETFGHHFRRDGGFMIGDSLRPKRFGRRIISRTVTRTVELEGDSIAYVEIVHTLVGEFIIGAHFIEDTTRSIRITKPFNLTMTSKLKFEKDESFTMNNRGWRLVGVTPTVGASDPSSIEFTTLTFVSVSGDEFTITDPLNTYLSRDNLPSFTSGDSVNVFLTLTNDGGDEFVVMHYAARSRQNKARKPMNDAGDPPDEIADDNIYAGGFMPRDTMMMGRMARIFVDAIDQETLSDPDSPVDTRIWALPYVLN